MQVAGTCVIETCLKRWQFGKKTKGKGLSPCPASPLLGGPGLGAPLLHAFGGAFCSALEPAKPFSVLSFPDELTRHSFLGESTWPADSPQPPPRPSLHDPGPGQPCPRAARGERCRDQHPHSLPILGLLDDEQDNPLDKHEEDEEADEPPNNAHDDKCHSVVCLHHCRREGAEGSQEGSRELPAAQPPQQSSKPLHQPPAHSRRP